ncbi:MAG: hypothetical protein CUN56_01550 [Phototrophicales bacterium]|nr:MAG: hypothetical protein CUN56_01550 [Phototrophicales bacterium]RMG76375.1 MAG: MBL fold metallo-hydrolase [Chloroflexota bacterium]
MQLTFLGGADEVGASSTLVEISGKKILVDAGIRISPRTSRGIQNDQLPDLHPISLAGGPDFILVTHAHTDHTGALPLVVEQYPHVPVMGTRPTFTLTRILQRDAQRIMKSKQEQEGELPIFDEVASQRLMDAFQIVEFRQPIKLGESLQVTYHPAGHIAGAAMLVFESDEGTLVMSGDVSLNNQRAVVSAAVPNIKADALVLESTYGGKLHANRDAEEKRLIETLQRVIERGGKALIPAFALGRAQEVLQIILAYRDVFDAPVYVDGMVRSVCDGYAGFPDLLPNHTVKAAGQDHLFFRKNIKPVTSAAMRDQIANSTEPLVVVASSGMLTGGASVVYARAFAPDARNAIFLTGYQDEEAPGKALQRMMKERHENETASWKLDGKTVTVRCELGTYSLSAHADEMELVNMAEAFDTQEVMLVHGDHGARHSLATALRQRAKRVIQPKIGHTEVFHFAKRPWAIGSKIKSGSHKDDLNPAALWNALKAEAGNFYSARELAQMWWGDADRAPEAIRALSDSVYFAQDWRRKDTFQVKSAEQVARSQRQRAIMMANPDLVGKLVILRDSNNRPRAGKVEVASIDSFEAAVQSAKGRHYPADALLWVIGDWEGYPKGHGVRGQLNELVKKAKTLQDQLLPFNKRQQLVVANQPILPESLLPDTLPPDVTRTEALTAIVLALAADGATLEQGGLLPKRAREGEPLEQNQAREVALASFPPDARLRKVGMEVHRKRLILTFDFPDHAMSQYADEIDELEEKTGWEVSVKPGVNQMALSMALDELMPEGATLVKGPSFYLDRGEVGAEINFVNEDDKQALQQDYFALTGYRLVLSGKTDQSAQDIQNIAVPSRKDRMEINAAYAMIRDALNPYGLYKTSLKQGQIILAFISPQVGERHLEIIQWLSEETGYPISIHPHPNQQQIIQIANTLLREAGWSVRKGPGIHTDRAEVSVTVVPLPDEASIQQVDDEFYEATGYHLVVS